MSDGATLRHHLESVYRQTGIMPDKLVPVEFPNVFEFVWHDFCELDRARTNNGYTVNPLSYSEIAHWNDLTNRDISGKEVEIIKMLDILYLQEIMKKEKS